MVDGRGMQWWRGTRVRDLSAPSILYIYPENGCETFGPAGKKISDWPICRKQPA